MLGAVAKAGSERPFEPRRRDAPDPDFAVRPGKPSPDPNVYPQPLLIIEVSDGTLMFGQVVKSSLYAANGIEDDWVVNVNDRQVEVRRSQPRMPPGVSAGAMECSASIELPSRSHHWQNQMRRSKSRGCSPKSRRSQRYSFFSGRRSLTMPKIRLLACRAESPPAAEQNRQGWLADDAREAREEAHRFAKFAAARTAALIAPLFRPAQPAAGQLCLRLGYREIEASVAVAR
jgi:Putative restriction endonuclease